MTERAIAATAPAAGVDSGPINPMLLTIPEAARLAGMGRSTIYEMIGRRALPGVVRLGRSVRIKRCDLERWIAELPTDAAA